MAEASNEIGRYRGRFQRDYVQGDTPEDIPVVLRFPDTQLTPKYLFGQPKRQIGPVENHPKANKLQDDERNNAFVDLLHFH